MDGNWRKLMKNVNSIYETLTPISKSKVEGWYSLITLQNNLQVIGLNKKGELCTDTVKRNEVIDDTAKFISIITIFEENVNVVRKEINRSYYSLGLIGDREFPYEKLIAYALFISDYWAELALDWYEAIKDEISLNITAELRRLSTRNQELKQRVKRILSEK